MSDINEFLEMLELRESWTVNHDNDLLKRCLFIADRIITQPDKTAQISFNNWLVFMSSLPYKLSLICLSRLDDSLGDVIPKLVRPQLNNSLLNEARMIMIHRCNIVVRKELQQDLFEGNEKVIMKIARAINLERDE